MPYCRACGAEIIFVKTVAGKTMPLNVEPVAVRETGPEPGNTFIRKDGSMVFGEIVGDAEDVQPTVEAYVSHFATCPYGGRFRRRQKSERTRGL